MPKSRTPVSAALTVQASFWLMAGGESLGGRGRIELLERIEQTGSIRQAALGMGMSYRAAWGAVAVMHRRLGVPLVLRTTGGAGGGGATLSAAGSALVKTYRKLEVAHARHTVQLNRALLKLAAGLETVPTAAPQPKHNAVAKRPSSRKRRQA